MRRTTLHVPGLVWLLLTTIGLILIPSPVTQTNEAQAAVPKVQIVKKQKAQINKQARIIRQLRSTVRTQRTRIATLQAQPSRIEYRDVERVVYDTSGTQALQTQLDQERARNEILSNGVTQDLLPLVSAMQPRDLWALMPAMHDRFNGYDTGDPWSAYYHSTSTLYLGYSFYCDGSFCRRS